MNENQKAILHVGYTRYSFTHCAVVNFFLQNCTKFGSLRQLDNAFGAHWKVKVKYI